MKRRIYLASSWRNQQQPAVVRLLRGDGHEVYDFRKPDGTVPSFSWSETARNWREWLPRDFMTAVVESPAAQRGFARDKAALDWCDTLVLLLPCGRSAHLEAGYARGQGKQVVIVLSEDKFEAELMYLLADGLVASVGDLIAHLRFHPQRHTATTAGFNSLVPDSQLAAFPPVRLGVEP